MGYKVTVEESHCKTENGLSEIGRNAEDHHHATMGK